MSDGTVISGQVGMGLDSIIPGGYDWSWRSEMVASLESADRRTEMEKSIVVRISSESWNDSFEASMKFTFKEGEEASAFDRVVLFLDGIISDSEGYLFKGSDEVWAEAVVSGRCSVSIGMSDVFPTSAEAKQAVLDYLSFEKNL